MDDGMRSPRVIGCGYSKERAPETCLRHDGHGFITSFLGMEEVDCHW
jgi:hypothetical protein